MINFRYHVVTLVAVFLALGLGILFGASFIDQNTVKALETAQNRLSARSDRLVDRVKTLEGERDALERFTETAAGYLISGALTGRPALILSFESTSKTAVESVASSLTRSGAVIDGSVQLSENLDMSNDTRRQQVALAIGGAASDENALAKMLVDELAGAMAAKKPGSLKRLADSGLASNRDVANVDPKDLATVPTPGTLIVVVTGGETSKLMLERVIFPSIEGLAAQGGIVAVVEGGPIVKDGLLDKVRSERGLRVVSVDSVQKALGQTALALGLRAAIDGRFGHYGIGEGADAPIPEITPRN